jgi:hypothetical protein
MSKRFTLPMRKRNQRRRQTKTYKKGGNPVTSMSRTVSDGVYRLRDTLTLSSGSTGNIKQIISRSYTQFTEEKSLTALYTEVRLLSFECSITPSQVYANSDSDFKNLQQGWMAIGTTPATTTTDPSTGNQILAQSDSREFFLRNRITPFHFKSVVTTRGYLPTPFASETSYSFAGCPGSILIGNLLGSSEVPDSDLMYVVITGVYQFTGRTT